jgi:hypothetical protein
MTPVDGIALLGPSTIKSGSPSCQPLLDRAFERLGVDFERVFLPFASRCARIDPAYQGAKLVVL